VFEVNSFNIVVAIAVAHALFSIFYVTYANTYIKKRFQKTQQRFERNHKAFKTQQKFNAEKL
jgi:hypothetical protein